MIQFIQHSHTAPLTDQELSDALVQICEEIPDDISHLINSMSRCCQAPYKKWCLLKSRLTKDAVLD